MSRRVIIIGAGISGLSLCWYLRKRFSPAELEIVFLEASNRVGGWIRTEAVGDSFFECGPHSIRSKEGELMSLLQELGLEEEIIYASPDAKNRYLVKDGKLAQLPNSLLSLFTTSLGRKIVRGCLLEPFRKRGPGGDESVADFFRRRFSQDFVNTFINPLIAGIYAAGPEALSMQSAFASLVQLEKDEGSLVKRMLKKRGGGSGSQLFSFRSGMELLPKTLAKQIDAEIRLNCKVVKIQETKDFVEVEYEGGKICDKISCDYLFSTLGPNQLRGVLQGNDPLHKYIPVVPQTSLVAVSLGFEKALLKTPGFGLLASSIEEKELLGIVFDSSIFPAQNGAAKTRLSVMMGGQRAPHISSIEENQLVLMAKGFCSKYLHIETPPEYLHTTRAINAVSCYPVGHSAQLETAEMHLKLRKMEFLGAGFYGVSIPDCILRAKTCAEKFKFLF